MTCYELELFVSLIILGILSYWKLIYFFRLLLEELVIYIEHCPKASFATQWKNVVHKCPFPLNEAFKPKSWKQIYNMGSVNASLSRIQMVGYNEKIVSSVYHFRCADSIC